MSTTRRPLVVGNWKMNGSRSQATSLVSGLLAKLQAPRAEVVLCPPAPYLPLLAAQLVGSKLALGAQDVSAEAPGAHTGEVAAEMLRDVGCAYVIVGHSERRRDQGEDDALVNAKLAAGLAAGLKVIVCIGESLQERDAGLTEQVVGRQLSAILPRLTQAPDAVVLAYEPIWAIGTGRTASSELAEAVHAYLRQQVGAVAPAAADSLAILYGGSVTAAVAPGLFSMPNIDGALVGGASLKAEEFSAICLAA